ncbi:MAG: ERF family protein [Methanoregulaceae archaeon]
MAEEKKEGKLEVLGKLNNIPTDKENPYYNSRYASLAAILEEVRPKLAEAGLVVSQTIGDGECVTALLDWDGNAVLKNSVPIAVTDENDPQKIASAITYARRYGISALLGIATEEDDDANAASEPPAPKPKPRVNSNLPATPRQKQAIKKMLYKAGVWENADDEGVEGKLTRAENLKRTTELFGGLGIDVEVAAGVNPLEGLDVAQASAVIEELGKRIEGKENHS